MKNIGQYNQDLSVPRKKDIDSLETRVKTNEDNIAMAESDIEGLNTDVGTLKTDVSNVKTALSSKQDTIVGAASTIVEDNLTAGKVLVSDASGKVGVANVGIDDINPDGKYLKLSGGTLTGDLTLGYDAKGTPVKLKMGTGEDSGIVIASVNTQFGIADKDEKNILLLLDPMDFALFGRKYLVSYDVTNTLVTMQSSSRLQIKAKDEIHIANDNAAITLESSGSINMNNQKVAGVADATNANDAVNLGQLNEVKKSIPSSSDFVKTSGGVVTGTLYLFGGTGALNVKNGSVTLNEGYSIGYGDGNYNFNQMAGDFSISKGNTEEGTYIASEGDGFRVTVNNIEQTADITVQISSEGIIDLSATSGKNTNEVISNVKISGVADGIEDSDAVNLGQLNAVKNSIPDTSNFAPATAGLKVLSDTGGTFQYLGSVTTKLYYYSFTSQYSLPSNAVLLDIAIPYSSTIGIFKVMCSYIQSWSPAKIWFMSMNYVTDFTHDGSTKIYYMLA